MFCVSGCVCLYTTETCVLCTKSPVPSILVLYSESLINLSNYVENCSAPIQGCPFLYISARQSFHVMEINVVPSAKKEESTPFSFFCLAEVLRKLKVQTLLSSQKSNPASIFQDLEDADCHYCVWELCLYWGSVQGCQNVSEIGEHQAEKIHLVCDFVVLRLMVAVHGQVRRDVPLCLELSLLIQGRDSSRAELPLT